MVLSGVLLGLAASCKWNAVFSIAALFLVGTILYWRQRNFSFPVLLASLSALPAASYAVRFVPLFRALGRPLYPGESSRHAARHVYLDEIVSRQ